MKILISIILSLIIFFGITKDIYSQLFSVESIINQGHAISKRSYFDVIKKYTPYLKEKAETERKETGRFVQYVKMDISDSTANSIFKIKKGDYVLQFLNGKFVAIDSIAGFYLIRWNGHVHYVFHFRLYNNIERHELWGDNKANEFYFYIICKDKKLIPYIKKEVTSSTITANEYEEIESSFWQYVLENSDELANKTYYLSTFRNKTASSEEKIKNIFGKYSLENIFKIDINNDGKEDYILSTSSFCFFKISDLKDPVFIPHAFLQQVFQVRNTVYILLREYKDSTGIRGRSVYKYENSEKSLIAVFRDFSKSD